MSKYKNYWHTNKEIPENGSCVLWKAKLFSKERGNIEGGRYDRYYDCFCGTASLFVNRSSIKQWIYCKDVFNILDQNTRLQAQLDREIHINRIMLNAINFYANKNFWYDRDDESGWEVAQQTLKQIEGME